MPARRAGPRPRPRGGRCRARRRAPCRPSGSAPRAAAPWPAARAGSRRRGGPPGLRVLRLGETPARRGDRPSPSSLGPTARRPRSRIGVRGGPARPAAGWRRPWSRGRAGPNGAFEAPARIGASRTSHEVFASGTRSPGPSRSEAHPRQAVAHGVLGRLERQPVQRLRHRHPEPRHRGESRPPFQRGVVPSALSKTGRNVPNPAGAASVSSRSPRAGISARGDPPQTRTRAEPPSSPPTAVTPSRSWPSPAGEMPGW
jgi:hypothetical protein